MQRNIFFLIIISILLACNGDSFNLHVKYIETPGLNTESEVFCQGVKIGKVEAINLINDSVLVSIKFNEEVKIPINSRFQFYSIDLLGTKGIQITKSNESEYYKNNDTIQGIKAKTLQESVDDTMKDVKSDSSFQNKLG